MPWPDVARQLDVQLTAQQRSPIVEQALFRLQSAARAAAAAGASPLEVSVGGISDDQLLRGFDSAPRAEGEAGAALSWLGDRFAASLRVTAVSGPDDGQDLRLDGSYLGATVGNFIVSAGVVDRWWGPGWDGSLILGTNSRPIPAVSLERKYSDPSRWPVLRALGPWRASIAIGQAEGSRVAVPDARFLAARVTFKPRSWLEVGLSRTAQWCGTNRPCDLNTFRDLLLGQDNRSASLSREQEPGNQMAGYDLRLRSPWRRLPLTLYGQFIGEDEAGGLPAKFLGLYGLETWGGGERLGSWRARFEFADTACGFSRSDPLFDCAYRNDLYAQGYSYRDRIIGHPLDNDGRMSTASLLWVAPSGVSVSVLARRVEFNRDGRADPAHRLSPAGVTSLRNLEARVEGRWRGTTIEAGVGYDSYSPASGLGSETRGSLQLRRGL